MKVGGNSDLFYGSYTALRGPVIVMNDFYYALKNKMVWICALGYFVDMFDLVLFGIVRVPSLKDIGVAEDQIHAIGAQLLNYQMAGLIAGGFIWGLWGDKAGRLKTLFASIFIYSLANILNAFVTQVETYAVLRFVAGFGLAGELGVAVTLLTEILPQKIRGLGTMIIGFAGFLGAISAALTANYFSWKIAYITGGTVGLALLITRVSAQESFLFSNSKVKNTFHQTLQILFTSKERLIKYLKLLLVGVPIWYVAGILIYFAPEFANELNIKEPVSAGSAIMWCYVGSLLGDIFSGFLSQVLQSRKKSIFCFLLVILFSFNFYFFFLNGASAIQLYFICFLLGIGNGYWTLLITMSAENFGTNLRATVSTSIPNLVRGAVIPLSFLFQFGTQHFSKLQTAWSLGWMCLLIAFLSLTLLPETFHHHMDYQEE